MENSYCATFAQIFGGIAIGIDVYYTWNRIGRPALYDWCFEALKC